MENMFKHLERLIESGSDKYQYLTSHTAREYLRQGVSIVIGGTPNSTKSN